MGHFARSKALFYETLNVLKKDKELVWFPILSGFFSLIILATFIVPFFLANGIESNFYLESSFLLWIFLFYLASYFIVIFFNTGLIICADIRLKGGDPTVKDGLKGAFKKIIPILIWSLISATVGMALKQLSRKGGTVGKIVSAIVGFAWGLLTYFVVPVMVFENLNPFRAIKESGVLFKKTWGERFIAHFALGLFMFVLFIIPVVILLIVGFLISLAYPSLITWLVIGGIILLYILALGILSTTLQGIFQTALYIYAKTGKTPDSFTPEHISGAFKPRSGMLNKHL
jgi:hypothetical protein